MTDSAVFHDSDDDTYRDAVGPLTFGGGDMATDNLWDAKGDLAVGTADNMATRLAVGTADGYVLTVDAAEPTGIKWAAAAGGGPPSGSAGGVLDGTYPNPGLAASVAGDGLAETTNVLSVNVDGSTLEISSDSLRVKDGGITAAKVAADVATQAELDAHITDATDAHDASAISVADSGGLYTGADVEAVLAEMGLPVTEAEAEAGTDTSIKRWTAERVAQAIAALGFAPDVTMQVKTDTSGTYTPTTGMVKVLVICVGGGGGAPAATGADEAVSGGGGGGAAIKLFDAATIGASKAYAVGQTSTAGGNASGLGAANNLLQATGGAVGVASGNLTVAAIKGGLGGIGTLGDLNIRGGPGGHAAILSTTISHGGNGGNSIFGGGGRGGSTASSVEQGEAGQAYGGGAGGGKTSDGTDLSAVAGAAGVIYFIEFLKTGGGAGAAAEAGATELIYKYTVTGSDKASIDTGVDTADAGSLDWTNGDVLEIWIYARTDESVANSSVAIHLNNDTGANYDQHLFRAINTTVTGLASNARSNWTPALAGASAAANVFGNARLSVPNYTGTVGYKTGEMIASIVDTAAANTQTVNHGVSWRNTAAITRVAISVITAAKLLKVGSQLLIYKRRSV